MNRTVLCVDDEPNVLRAHARNLRHRYDLLTATSGAAALEFFDADLPVAVVVSDMKMPGMNGVALLEEIRRRSPDTVRIMLTGVADLDVAMAAVNEGHIFRLLAKPCATDDLARGIDAGLRHFELVTSERELLEKTLSGSINLLTEMLSMLDPVIFGEAVDLRRKAGHVARALGSAAVWDVELAAMLSGIGLFTIPAELARRWRASLELGRRERRLLDRVPEIGYQLLSNIPRLEGVALSVRHQLKGLDGSGIPTTPVSKDDIPPGARILKVLRDLHAFEASGLNSFAALERLRDAPTPYDADVLDAVQKILIEDLWSNGGVELVGDSIPFADVAVGMIAFKDIVTTDGVVLVTGGREITSALLIRLRNWVEWRKIVEPISVLRVAGIRPWPTSP